MSARAYLVESIPKGMEDLRDTPGVQYTEDVLARLTSAAQSTIDLTAMYWALVPDSSSDDEEGFTAAQLEAMGAGAGAALYQNLREAARRGVHIRILQSPGFSGQKQESETLQAEFPDRISINSIDMGQWYGGSGIMHQKIWIFDRRDIYLGSANMDWKSLTQVKEMGAAVENCPQLAADATNYFDGWCKFSELTASSVEVFDPLARVDRLVPPWSTLVPEARRAGSPLASDQYAAAYNRQNPLPLELNGEQGEYLSPDVPMKFAVQVELGTGEGIVETIHDARKSVCLSVMDFAPVGLYSRKSAGPPLGEEGVVPTNTPVWWPSLFDALLHGVLTRKIYVRVLVSKWAHTSGLIEPYLRALQNVADAGRDDSYMIAGQLEIKQFIIPGWNSTNGSRRKYPGHTRVNHTKYIVTDRRINIGTSNMTWDYFACTAGSSLNSDHPGLVRTLQSVFDRDWSSSYAWRLA